MAWQKEKKKISELSTIHYYYYYFICNFFFVNVQWFLTCKLILPPKNLSDTRLYGKNYSQNRDGHTLSQIQPLSLGAVYEKRVNNYIAFIYKSV